MTRAIIILLLCFGTFYSAYAQELVIQSAREQIGVTTGFDGSEIIIFGDRRDPQADIAIVVEGPLSKVTLWEKERILGAWVNASHAKFENVPGYYHYATSLSQEDKNTEGILRKNGIGYEALFDMLPTEIKSKSNKLKIFQAALRNKKEEENVFFNTPTEITFMTDHFFKVEFKIPPSAPTGEYKIHNYLIKEGEVKEHSFDVFKVEQVGLNAFIYNAAYNSSVIYALICVFLAAFTGWFASILKVKP